MDERPIKRRPHDLRESRAGAALGGAVGFAGPWLAALVVQSSPFTSPGRLLADGVAIAVGAGFYGVFWGLLGAWWARRVRDRRGENWSDFRTSLVGGYAAGTIAGFLWLALPI